MQLKRHIRMAHRNENEFECRLCVKSFTSEYYLKVHEKEVHTQNFKCENCDKLFGSLKRLNGHKKRIHGEKNLKCPNCDSCFSTRGDLNTHIKRSHDPSKNNDSLIVPSENNDPLLVWMIHFCQRFPPRLWKCRDVVMLLKLEGPRLPKIIVSLFYLKK